MATVRCFAGVDNKKALEQAERIYETDLLTPIATMVLAATVVKLAVEEHNVSLLKKYSNLYLENRDWKVAYKTEALVQINLDFPRFFNRREIEGKI